MKNNTLETCIDPFLSRRNVLAALAASAVVSGCKSVPEDKKAESHFKPASAPGTTVTPEDLSKIRASLALWLLFTTYKKYFPVIPDGMKPGVYKFDTPGLVLSDLVTDLEYLPGNTSTEKLTLIQHLQDKAVSGYWNATVLTATCGPQSVNIPYAVCLAGAQDLFQKFGLGQLTSNTTNPDESPYAPGDTYCPTSVSHILSIAPRKIVTQDPS